MTEPSSEKLAKALDEAGLTDMAILARQDHFHDFQSDLALPELELDNMLVRAIQNCQDLEQKAKIMDIRAKHHEGFWDATKEESDKWAKSPEGQETFKSLIETKRKR